MNSLSEVIAQHQPQQVAWKRLSSRQPAIHPAARQAAVQRFARRAGEPVVAEYTGCSEAGGGR